MWEALGLTATEGTVYEALAGRGPSTTADLTNAVAFDRSHVSLALDRLVEIGLATRRAGRPALYSSQPPDLVAATRIAERERDLARLRAHAQRLAAEIAQRQASRRHPTAEIELIEGAGNITATMVRLQRNARRRIRGFDRPPYLDSPLTDNEEESRHLAERTIEYRVVYDRSSLEIDGRMAIVWQGIHSGERARVSASVPIKMILADEDLALIPATSQCDSMEVSLLVRPSPMLDSLMALFEHVWDRAVPINRPASDPDAPGATSQQSTLLGLLAGGATDESIARTLGWSVRTVHRHVRRLMDGLGAETRFQLGMEAVRRGWI